MSTSSLADRSFSRPMGSMAHERALNRGLSSSSSRLFARSSKLVTFKSRQVGRLTSKTSRGLDVVAMAGKISGKISLALEAGKANPAPPVGPALGAKGVNIMEFCKQYNAQTQDKAGQIIPVEITVYEDRSFTFIMKTPPASFLLKEAAGVKKGAANPLKEKVGEVTRDQIRTIAETKMPDLNCRTIESAVKIIEGTAKNMGLKVAD